MNPKSGADHTGLGLLVSHFPVLHKLPINHFKRETYVKVAEGGQGQGKGSEVVKTSSRSLKDLPSHELAPNLKS